MYGYGHENAWAEIAQDAEALDEDSRAALAVLRAASEELPESIRPGYLAQLADLLGKRLQLLADRHANQAIVREHIEAPIIICGLPRSGTSLLHALLALDPENRAPRAFEMLAPSPPNPDVAERARRIAASSAGIRGFLTAMPGLLKAHPYWDEGGETAIECEDIMQLSFVSPYFQGFFRIPQYAKWLASADHHAAYAVHREFLQHLQWGSDPRRWVLKGVAHTGHFDCIAETYPDACIVWPHREPVEQFASLATIVAITRRATEPDALRAICEEFLDMTTANIRAGLAHRFSGDGRVAHLRFTELSRDPFGAICRLYERLGRRVSAEHKQRMCAWISSPANDPARHGRVAVDLSRFGITASAVRERFAFYYDSAHFDA